MSDVPAWVLLVGVFVMTLLLVFTVCACARAPSLLAGQ